MFKFGFGQDVGIDLGTATVIVYIKGKGIVLREPSVISVNAKTGGIIATGFEERAKTAAGTSTFRGSIHTPGIAVPEFLKK